MIISKFCVAGSRIGKNWFLVRDSTTKTERLLTMTPVSDACPIKYHAQAKQVLHELFLAIQHPYIYPVLDIDRKVIMEQEYVITVVPFNEEGTLKDLIYQVIPSFIHVFSGAFFMHLPFY